MVAATLERAFAEAAAGQGDALARAIRRFALPHRPFDDLLEGVSWDIEPRGYADTAALREYCYRVASTVGLLCVRVFGCADGEADAYARELGVALQWTNILRDVGPDLARGRVYLPQDALARHGLAPAELDRTDPATRRRLSALIREQAAYARECYARAESLRPPHAAGRLLAAEIMAGVYRVLLRRVERRGADVVLRPPRVGALRRGLIAAGLVVRRRLTRRHVCPS